MTKKYSTAFNNALKRSLIYEGGYANDPDDKGGETFQGISRRIWPDWPGWELIDQAKTNPQAIDQQFHSDKRMEAMVADFYQTNFWQPLLVLNAPERLTAKMFDTSINLGKKGATIVLQRSLNQTALPSTPLKEDGLIGPMTLEALKLVLMGNGEPLLLENFVKKQSEYYRRIVERNPAQSKFLKGWLFRAAWVPK